MPYKRTRKHRLIMRLPAMVKSGNYEPSGTQIIVLCAYLQSLDAAEFKKPTQILKDLDKSPDNWNKWQRRDGFIDWWNGACEEYHKSIGLSSVHSHMLRRALQESPQDAKLFMERFDPKYKPKQSVEHYPGQQPPEGPETGVEAIQASRDFIDRVDAEQDAKVMDERGN